jgi:hypothetical protein
LGRSAGVFYGSIPPSQRKNTCKTGIPGESADIRNLRWKKHLQPHFMAMQHIRHEWRDVVVHIRK